MSKQVFINIPISDLAKATAFYEALGFVKQPDFSDENASGMKWSDEIFVMLLTHDFYKKFLRGKDVADPIKTSGVLLALSLESKDAVQQFADTAKKNGGDYYQVDMGVPQDMMFGYEVLDLDGNQWEPVWMSSDFNPKA
ncbi:MAG: Glyoxalase family protein [Candidatus Saccharibacteria bacterium]|nr:Glyoxalase family protein [Candidatus Saccharibacteria bacterium]